MDNSHLEIFRIQVFRSLSEFSLWVDLYNCEKGKFYGTSPLNSLLSKR